MRPAQRHAREWRWRQQEQLHRSTRYAPAASREAVMTLWLALAAGIGLVVGIAVATIR